MPVFRITLIFAVVCWPCKMRMFVVNEPMFV